MPSVFIFYCPKPVLAPKAYWVGALNPTNFQIQCGLNGCQRTFTTFSVYCNHLSLEHQSRYSQGNALLLEEPPPPPDILNTSTDSEGHGGHEDNLDEPGGNCSMDELQPPNRSEIIQRNAAMWILKTKEYRRLTQTAVNGIIENVGHLFEMSFQKGFFCTSRCCFCPWYRCYCYPRAHKHIHSHKSICVSIPS